MRQASLISIVRKYSYSILLVTLFILLAAIASFQSREVRVQGEETETKTATKTEATGQSSGMENTSENNNNSGDTSTKRQSTNNTKVKVSIKTSMVNGETTGSASIQVTQNGETTAFSEEFNETVDGCDFNINVTNGEFEFDCEFDQKTKNEVKTSTSIKIKNESCCTSTIVIRFMTSCHGVY